MRVFLALIIGVAIGAGAIWYYSTSQGRSRVQTTGERIQSAAKSAGQTIEDKVRGLHLSTNEIKDELARAGTIIRKKAQEAGRAIADSTADARTTGAIKAKLVADRDLSALSISVNTTRGIVTLSGTVPSTEAIGKAILLAYETDGV